MALRRASKEIVSRENPARQLNWRRPDNAT
jgi:hypothetical protein